jgi:hypothetical protein
VHAVPASVIDPIWDQFQALVPTVVDTHPTAGIVVASPSGSCSTSSSRSFFRCRVRQDRRWKLLGHHDSSAAR